MDELQAIPLAKCRERLPMLEARQSKNCRNAVTGDEKQFNLETGHSAQWSIGRNDLPAKTKPMIGAPKFISQKERNSFLRQRSAGFNTT
jgi:hypothetical protein